MEQQFITAARGASCFMHAASFRAFINEPGLTKLPQTVLQAVQWPPVCLCVCVLVCVNKQARGSG